MKLFFIINRKDCTFKYKKNLTKYSVVFFKAFSKRKGIWQTLYISLSNELSVEKCSKVLMVFDCLGQNVSISSLSDYQKSFNILVLCKYYYLSLRKQTKATSGG